MKKLIMISGVFLLTGCTLTVKDLGFEQLAYKLKSYDVGTTGFNINSPLIQNRIVLLQGSMNFSKCEAICESLVYLNEKNPDNKITLLINSKGGNLDACMPIINIIKSSKAPVDTVNTGFCFSAAVLVFRSATGKKYACKDSMFLLHATKGKPKELTKKMNELNTAIIRDGTNLPEEWFPLTDKTVIFDAEEALKYGFVDEVIDSNGLLNVAIPGATERIMGQ